MIYLENNNIKLNLVDNKLYLTFLHCNFNNNDYLKVIEKLESFFSITKKNDNRFYFIIDISNISMLKIKKIYGYITKCSHFFKKHEKFIEKHLFGTIIIMENKINKMVFNFFLKLYNPKRPYKIIKKNKNFEDILNDFAF